MKRDDWVEAGITTALATSPRTGLTTSELIRDRLRLDGAMPGTPDAAWRAVWKDSPQRAEVLAALARLRRAGEVKNPDTGRHPDVWLLIGA